MYDNNARKARIVNDELQMRFKLRNRITTLDARVPVTIEFQNNYVTIVYICISVSMSCAILRHTLKIICY